MTLTKQKEAEILQEYLAYWESPHGIAALIYGEKIKNMQRPGTALRVVLAALLNQTVQKMLFFVFMRRSKEEKNYM